MTNIFNDLVSKTTMWWPYNLSERAMLPWKFFSKKISQRIFRPIRMWVLGGISLETIVFTKTCIMESRMVFEAELFKL